MMFQFCKGNAWRYGKRIRRSSSQSTRGCYDWGGCKILGNIEVGKYAKIGANSVVLNPVPEYATAAGVPARIVSQDKAAKPAFDMNQYFIGIDDGMNLNI